MSRMNIDAVYWPAILCTNTVASISKGHKQIVRYARDNNLTDICIAEDDIQFTSIKGWQYFLDNKPEDFDIYIGGHYSGIHLPDNSVYSFTGLTIYCISSRFYNTFLSTNELRNIDGALAGSGRFVVCNPEIAKQLNGYSFHRKKVINDDSHLEGRKFLTDEP
jgi:hypothetical protein